MTPTNVGSGPPDRDRSRARNDLAAKLDAAGTALHISRVKVPADSAPLSERAVFEARVACGEMRLRRLNEELEYQAGYRDGFEAGRREVEAELAEDFARLRDWVLQSASPRALAYAERRQRERLWVLPRPGDFTGRLTPEQYFGTDTAPGRRAA